MWYPNVQMFHTLASSSQPTLNVSSSNWNFVAVYIWCITYIFSESYQRKDSNQLVRLDLTGITGVSNFLELSF